MQTYIEALCHGNLDEEEALKIANIFKQTLVKNVLPPELRPQERIIKLPLGSSLLHSANVKNESEENSVVEVFTFGACRLYFNFWTILGQAFVGDSPFSPAPANVVCVDDRCIFKGSKIWEGTPSELEG